MKLDTGYLYINTLTNERKLIMHKNEAKGYLNSIIPNLRICSYKEYTDEERLQVLRYNFNTMKEFNNKLVGSGRTFSNSIQMDLDMFTWIMSKIDK